MLLIQENKQKLNSVGCVNLWARSIGLKLRLMILFITLITASGCTEFALVMSGSSIAISQNAYVKAYNGADFLTVISTEKSIKRHVYEKGKKYIVDYTKARALGIMSNH
jgi:hypothetical protein